MNNKIFITFDKSQEDIPVLTTFIENQFSMFGSGPSVTITNVITGDEAVDIWNRLNNKKKKEENNGQTAIERR